MKRPYNSTAVVDVVDERIRQQEVENFNFGQDDEYRGGELVRAALCYSINSLTWASLLTEGWSPERIEALSKNAGVPATWPWAREWWKPSSQRRNLVKAAALLIAEIERLDRLADAEATR